VPVTLIAEAVFARTLSSLKDDRVEASKALHGPAAATVPTDRQAFIDSVRDALCAPLAPSAVRHTGSGTHAAAQGTPPSWCRTRRATS
jgi:6-phosphogluconate dehydrogenase